MIVQRGDFTRVLEKLSQEKFLALDTETTGLFPYHGDTLFSISIASEKEEFYFNFLHYNNLPESMCLARAEMLTMQAFLFSVKDISWFIHNAKFDMTFLQKEGLRLAGKIYCTYVGARLENNDELNLALADCAKRIGMEKSDAVEAWIQDHAATEKRLINGRLLTAKKYADVPLAIISEYAEMDARVCYRLGRKQFDTFNLWTLRSGQSEYNINNVVKNEAELTKTIFAMEQIGAKVDADFCRRALEYEKEEMEKAKAKFKELSGEDFKTSSVLFQKVFESDKELWEYTEKENPSFVSGVLEKFTLEAAKEVLRYKASKNSYDFFNGFLFAMGGDEIIHTSFNPGRARTGRFSSSNPNLQNLKRAAEKDADKKEFEVRRAIVPREGYFFAMLDYDQLEYRMMLDIAESHKLIDEVLRGLDVHEATAKIAGISRREAKTCNFLTLYGGGISKLSKALGVTEEKARLIQHSIFNAAPEVRKFIRSTIGQVESTGTITNWFGRRYQFSNLSVAYKAPNYVIQGGAADIIKIAMNKIHKYLEPKKSRMILTIHDELILEVAYGEEYIVEKCKYFMQNTYPHKRLPLLVSVEYSTLSLADKTDKMPKRGSGDAARDAVQEQGTAIASVTTKHVASENTANGTAGYA